MILERERVQVVQYCQRMLKEGLTLGTGGNISALDPETGYLAISASGFDYMEMTPADVVVMDLNGNKIDCDHKPSSEYPMHSHIYRSRPDVKGIVHTHSKYCTILSTLGETLKPCLVQLAVVGFDVPCANYHPVGSEGLAASAARLLENRDAILMACHGMLAVGNGIPQAYKYAEYVEFTAEVYYKARLLGNPYILSESEMFYEISEFKGPPKF